MGLRILHYGVCFSAAFLNWAVGFPLIKAALMGDIKINDAPSTIIPAIVGFAFIMQGFYWLVKEPSHD